MFLKPGVATDLCVAKIIKCVAKSSKQSICYAKWPILKSIYFVLCVANKKSDLKSVAVLRRLRTTAQSTLSLDFQLRLSTLRLSERNLYSPHSTFFLPFPGKCSSLTYNTQKALILYFIAQKLTSWFKLVSAVKTPRP